MEVSHGIKRNAVLVLLKSGDQLLLLKRKKEPHKGLFTPIGGKLEPFENPTTCAIRETREETGIEITDLRYVGSIIESSETSYNWNCPVYLAEIPFQEAPPCDEGELSWVQIKELGSLPQPPSDAAIYAYALSGQAFFFNIEYDKNLQITSFREEIEGKEIEF